MTDRLTDSYNKKKQIQIDRQTDRQTDRHINRQPD